MSSVDARISEGRSRVISSADMTASHYLDQLELFTSNVVDTEALFRKSITYRSSCAQTYKPYDSLSIAVNEMDLDIHIPVEMNAQQDPSCFMRLASVSTSTHANQLSAQCGVVSGKNGFSLKYISQALDQQYVSGEKQISQASMTELLDVSQSSMSVPRKGLSELATRAVSLGQKDTVQVENAGSCLASQNIIDLCSIKDAIYIDHEDGHSNVDLSKPSTASVASFGKLVIAMTAISCLKQCIDAIHQAQTVQHKQIAPSIQRIGLDIETAMLDKKKCTNVTLEQSLAEHIEALRVKQDKLEERKQELEGEIEKQLHSAGIYAKSGDLCLLQVLSTVLTSIGGEVVLSTWEHVYSCLSILLPRYSQQNTTGELPDICILPPIIPIALNLLALLHCSRGQGGVEVCLDACILSLHCIQLHTGQPFTEFLPIYTQLQNLNLQESSIVDSYMMVPLQCICRCLLGLIEKSEDVRISTQVLSLYTGKELCQSNKYDQCQVQIVGAHKILIHQREYSCLFKHLDIFQQFDDTRNISHTSDTKKNSNTFVTRYEVLSWYIHGYIILLHCLAKHYNSVVFYHQNQWHVTTYDLYTTHKHDKQYTKYPILDCFVFNKKQPLQQIWAQVLHICMEAASMGIQQSQWIQQDVVYRQQYTCMIPGVVHEKIDTLNTQACTNQNLDRDYVDISTRIAQDIGGKERKEDVLYKNTSLLVFKNPVFLSFIYTNNTVYNVVDVLEQQDAYVPAPISKLDKDTNVVYTSAYQCVPLSCQILPLTMPYTVALAHGFPKRLALHPKGSMSFVHGGAIREIYTDIYQGKLLSCLVNMPHDPTSIFHTNNTNNTATIIDLSHLPFNYPPSYYTQIALFQQAKYPSTYTFNLQPHIQLQGLSSDLSNQVQTIEACQIPLYAIQPVRARMQIETVHRIQERNEVLMVDLVKRMNLKDLSVGITMQPLYTVCLHACVFSLDYVEKAQALIDVGYTKYPTYMTSQLHFVWYVLNMQKQNGKKMKILEEKCEKFAKLLHMTLNTRVLPTPTLSVHNTSKIYQEYQVQQEKNEQELQWKPSKGKNRTTSVTLGIGAAAEKLQKKQNTQSLMLDGSTNDSTKKTRKSSPVKQVTQVKKKSNTSNNSDNSDNSNNNTNTNNTNTNNTNNNNTTNTNNTTNNSKSSPKKLTPIIQPLPQPLPLDNGAIGSNSNSDRDNNNNNTKETSNSSPTKSSTPNKTLALQENTTDEVITMNTDDDQPLQQGSSHAANSILNPSTPTKSPKPSTTPQGTPQTTTMATDDMNFDDYAVFAD